MINVINARMAVNTINISIKNWPHLFIKNWVLY